MTIDISSYLYVGKKRRISFIKVECHVLRLPVPLITITNMAPFRLMSHKMCAVSPFGMCIKLLIKGRNLHMRAIGDAQGLPGQTIKAKVHT